MKTYFVIGFIVLSSALTTAKPRTVEGTYKNSVFGYSVEVPSGLKGITDDQSGPERQCRGRRDRRSIVEDNRECQKENDDTGDDHILI